MITFAQTHWVPVFAALGVLLIAVGVVELVRITARVLHRDRSGPDVGLGVLDQTQDMPRFRHGRVRRPVQPVRHAQHRVVAGPPQPVRVSTVYRSSTAVGGGRRG